MLENIYHDFDIKRVIEMYIFDDTRAVTVRPGGKALKALFLLGIIPVRFCYISKE